MIPCLTATNGPASESALPWSPRQVILLPASGLYRKLTGFTPLALPARFIPTSLHIALPFEGKSSHAKTHAIIRAFEP